MITFGSTPSDAEMVEIKVQRRCVTCGRETRLKGECAECQRSARVRRSLRDVLEGLKRAKYRNARSGPIPTLGQRGE